MLNDYSLIECFKLKEHLLDLQQELIGRRSNCYLAKLEEAENAFEQFGHTYNKNKTDFIKTYNKNKTDFIKTYIANSEEYIQLCEYCHKTNLLIEKTETRIEFLILNYE